MINFTFRIQNWFWWQPWYSNGFINLPGKGVLEYRCYWKMPSIWVLWVLAGVVFMKRTQFNFLIQFPNVLNKSYFGWSSSFPFIWWQLTLFFAINANNQVPSPLSLGLSPGSDALVFLQMGQRVSMQSAVGNEFAFTRSFLILTLPCSINLILRSGSAEMFSALALKIFKAHHQG